MDKKKQLKIPWLQFVEAAVLKLKEEYPNATSPIFMKSHGYEPDDEVYEIPEYVLLDLE